jgi:hypothetical protein
MFLRPEGCLYCLEMVKLVWFGVRKILERLSNPKLSSGFGLGSCQGLKFKPDKVFFYYFI